MQIWFRQVCMYANNIWWATKLFGDEKKLVLEMMRLLCGLRDWEVSAIFFSYIRIIKTEFV